MTQNFENKHCKIAAQMLSSEPGLLDYRLADYLNLIAELVKIAGGELVSRQVIAAAILTWQANEADDYTKKAVK